MTVNGANVNEAVTFNKLSEKNGSLQINSRFRPGADERDSWRTVTLEKDSTTYSFEVEVASGLIIDLPIGTYNVSCQGGSILSIITIELNKKTTVSLVAY